MVKKKPHSFTHDTLVIEKETNSQIKKEGKAYLQHLFDFYIIRMREKFKKNPLESFGIFLASFAVSVILFSLIMFILFNKIEMNLSAPSFSMLQAGGFSFSGKQKSSIEEFDPMALVSNIRSNKNGFILVDIRSAKDYEKGHIKKAVSVPVYSKEMLNIDGSLNERKIRDAFRDVIAQRKIIILYGDSAYSTYPGVVAQIIKGSERAKVLSVGWNEWAHFKNIWVPEGQWSEFNINDYIQRKE